jgi:hypothetical protein
MRGRQALTQASAQQPAGLSTNGIAERAQWTAQRGFATRFKRGVSGNPSGQSRLYHQCRKLARLAAPEAMQELVALAKTAADERVRTVCLIAILDRAGIGPIVCARQGEHS